MESNFGLSSMLSNELYLPLRTRKMTVNAALEAITPKVQTQINSLIGK